MAFRAEGVMVEPQPTTVHPVIPTVTCPWCKAGMRLAFVEPKAMTRSESDTLVFQCMICDCYVRQPVGKPAMPA
jgi:hypothetical protein